MKINENKAFRDLTTFRVGGRIKYYVEIDGKDEISKAIEFAKKNNLEVFIVGEGSDILVSDKNFNGIVVRYLGKKILHLGNGRVKANAGGIWDDLVEYAVEKNLQGIECLSGIPGTVGAAPIQNIGAYGQELRDVFVSLTAYDIYKEKFVEFGKDGCEFAYRDSFFKKMENWQKFIITDITLQLKENGKPKVKYDSLKNYLVERGMSNPSLGQVRDAVLNIRAGKFENPKKIGNAGSFFKNPSISFELSSRLKEKYPEIVLREQQNKTYKASAGWLIDKAGWKGKAYRSASVSPIHALILINPKGDAKAEDIMELSSKIIDDVNKKFGIKLEREVQLVNF